MSLTPPSHPPPLPYASRLRSAPPSFRQPPAPHPSKRSVRIRPHPSEEPTLSGDTPAARPTTLHPRSLWRGLPAQARGAALARPRAEGRGLARFNELAGDDALTALLGCCRSRRWAERVAAHRPYADAESLLAAGDQACDDLTAAELDEALAGESRSPLPLAAARGPGMLAAHTALRAAHAEYERRFRHVFVICLDGHHDDEVLDEVLFALRTRLGNAPAEERAVTAHELRRLARGRLARLAA